MNLHEIQEHCKHVYEKWDFVKRIIELYAEGVSWKGCDLIEIDAIKDGVRSMLVTGTGDFKLENKSEIISVQMPSNIPFEEPGHPFLWPVTQNAKHLDSMEKILGPSAGANEMFHFLVKDICLGLGAPHELLGPLSATADADAIMWGLTTFRGNIRTWRDYLSSRLGLSWNETWFLNGLAAYGPIYQVFKAQGIELKKLAMQVLDIAKSAMESSLISRQTYEQAVKWFR